MEIPRGPSFSEGAELLYATSISRRRCDCKPDHCRPAFADAAAKRDRPDCVLRHLTCALSPVPLKYPNQLRLSALHCGDSSIPPHPPLTRPALAEHEFWRLPEPLGPCFWNSVPELRRIPR